MPVNLLPLLRKPASDCVTNALPSVSIRCGKPQRSAMIMKRAAGRSRYGCSIHLNGLLTQRKSRLSMNSTTTVTSISTMRLPHFRGRSLNPRQPAQHQPQARHFYTRTNLSMSELAKQINEIADNIGKLRGGIEARVG